MGSYSLSTTVCAWPAMLDVVISASDQRLHPPWRSTWPSEADISIATCSIADRTDDRCCNGNALSPVQTTRRLPDALAARREQLESHDYDQQANFLFTFQQSAIFISEVKKCDSFFACGVAVSAFGFCRSNLAEDSDNVESNDSLHGDLQTLRLHNAQQTLCSRAVSEHNQQYLDENGQQADFYNKRNDYFTARPDPYEYLFGGALEAECGFAVNVCVLCAKQLVCKSSVVDCLHALFDGEVTRRPVSWTTRQRRCSCA